MVFRTHDLKKLGSFKEIEETQHIICECDTCKEKTTKQLKNSYIAWYAFMSLCNVISLYFFAKISLMLFFAIWMFELTLISYHAIVTNYMKYNDQL